MSDILSALKFCSGSVAKKDLLPALTHFAIEHGTVRGYNGVLALCSPIPFDIACKPHAATLIKAIANCDDTVQLSMTPNGRLSVKAGKFKMFVDCVQGDTPHAIPEGTRIELDGEALLKGLKAVSVFMSDDASRRWANGVLIKDQCLFATNNVVAVQHWIGCNLPAVVTIPKDAVKEMLRIGEGPTHAQLAEGSITFHYSGNRWLRTQLYDSGQWPDLGKLLDKPSTQGLLDDEIFVGLEVIKPFADQLNSVLFDAGRLTTHSQEGEGATYDLPSVVNDGKYNIEMLLLLKGVATSIDWGGYPAPCMFQGPMLRGALVGMKKL